LPLAARYTEPVQRPRGRQWAKGESGNPKGKPRGALSRRTIGASLAGILARKGKAVLTKAIMAALEGDVGAMRIVLDRCLPKERLVRIELPRIRGPGDAMRALAVIMDCAAEGSITTAEAANLSALARSYVEISAVAELREQVAAL
jgi:hypothetical protein